MREKTRRGDRKKRAKRGRNAGRETRREDEIKE